MGIVADVLDRAALEAARDQASERWGQIDALINGAGGNLPWATIPPEKAFSDLSFEAFQSR